MLSDLPKPGFFDRGMETVLVKMTSGYAAVLRWTLRQRWLVLLVMAASAAGSWWLFSNAKSELSPMEDRGVIFMPVRAPDGATLEYTARYLDAIEGITSQYPEFDRRFMFMGGGQVSTGNAVMRTVDW